jgi:hypothetical protein
MFVLHKRNVVRFVRAGQPDSEAAIGHVDLFGQREIEDACKEVSDTIDIGAIEQKMVEPAGAHAARVFRPDIGVPCRRRVGRQFHLRVKLQFVATRDHEAEAAAGAGQVALGDVLDRNPRVPDPLSEHIEIALGGDLEAGEIHSRGIGLTQNDAVTIEFVPASKVDPAVVPPAHHIEANSVDVVGHRSIHIEDADLDVARP